MSTLAYLYNSYNWAEICTFRVNSGKEKKNHWEDNVFLQLHLERKERCVVYLFAFWPSLLRDHNLVFPWPNVAPVGSLGVWLYSQDRFHRRILLRASKSKESPNSVRYFKALRSKLCLFFQSSCTSQLKNHSLDGIPLIKLGIFFFCMSYKTAVKPALRQNILFPRSSALKYEHLAVYINRWAVALAGCVMWVE